MILVSDAGNIHSVRKNQVSDAEKLAADTIALVGAAQRGPGLDRAFERVREQADRLLALVREPYKIGVIGEYSAGKTLFSASLLGFLDDLPVSDRAATGNVTRFRLRPVRDGDRTTVAARRVVFL